MADTAPAAPFVRRSATLPTSLLQHSPTTPSARGPRPDQQQASPQSETLFACPFARIYSFPTSRPGQKAPEAGTRPWTDRHERVRASGPLRIYRIPTNPDVCFLNSGELILTFMRRSQCWCVDGVSKFATMANMEVYRIELPYDSDDDAAVVDNFKSVLANVIRYERTACPFQRGFGEDLPEDNFSPTGTGRSRGPKSQARKWAFDSGWRPEDVDAETWRARHLRGSSPAESDEGSRGSGATDEMNHPRRSSPLPTPAADDDGPQIRPLSTHAYRSFTAPHKLSYEPADPSHKAHRREADEATDVPLTSPGGRVFVQDNSNRKSVAERVNGLTSPVSEEPPVLKPLPRVRTERLPQPPKIVETPVPSVEEEVAVEKDVVADATPGLGTVGSLNPAMKHVRIEEPLTPASSAPSEDSALFADHVKEALEDHKLKAAQSKQSFHTTRTGISPKPSTASLKPTPEVVEADEAEQTTSGSEAFADAVSELPPVAEELASPPSAADASLPSEHHDPPTQLQPQPQPQLERKESRRRLRPLHMRASQSLLNSSMRRQPSLSFITREANEPPPGMTSALISQTVSLLSGPPSGLLAVMVQIAARMARGTLGSGTAVFRYREGKVAPSGYRWMPGGWESDEDADWEEEEEGGAALGRDDEDDYGVPLGCDTPSRTRRREWSRRAKTDEGVGEGAECY